MFSLKGELAKVKFCHTCIWFRGT